MDRLRALPRELGRRYLWVNVPAFRLDLIEDQRVVASHRIIVGKPGSQTPSFQAQVTGVTVNPWWNVPCSIVDESIGKLVASNPAEAARRGYVASRDAKGHLTVRQKPGPDNALGRIKLEMPNPFDVYIHDTPSKDLFANTRRAFSHGCIRTEDPKSLAVILLGPAQESTVDMLLATNVSRTLKLAPPVPVYVLYLTAEADPDTPDGVATYPDIYRRDPR
jgi:murein L,D-transpeptidase YcbB/YkuD